MVSKSFILFMTIVLLCHEKIALTLVQIENLDDQALEKLFEELANDDSITQLSDDELDIELNDVLTETIGDAPSTSLKDHVKFSLFTRSNPDDAYTLELDDDDNLQESPFNTTWQTKVIIHGWVNSVTAPWIMAMRRNYLLAESYNVIVVNWDVFASLEYIVSAHSTRLVGERTGEFLNYLNAEANMSLRSVHIVGHSLGAQIAGYTGATVSGAVGRITGLDPAGPLFEIPILKGREKRLDSTDAEFVDIIHTCSGGLGFRRAIGHVDFFPNGGSFPQPGCNPPLSISCSHSRAHQLMIDSIIYPNEFVAVQCNNWDDYQAGNCSNGNSAIMGEYIDSDSEGRFYLETNAASPYGEG